MKCDYLRVAVVAPTGDTRTFKCDSFFESVKSFVFQDADKRVVAIVPLDWAVLVDHRTFNKAA